MIHGLSVVPELEHAQSRLLSSQRHVILLLGPTGRKVRRRLEVNFDRGDLLIQRYVEVVVEVAAVGADPFKGPVVLFAERSDLVNWGAGHDDHAGVLLGEVVQVGQVAGHVGASLAAFVGGRFEHVVVHDQLGFTPEEILERQFFASLGVGVAVAVEDVVLRDGDHGEGLEFGGDGVAGARVFFLLGQEGDAGCAPFFRCCDLH